MRKITSDAKKAFEGGYNYKGNNTEVKGGDMFLFGNKIAEYTSLFNDGNKDINITTAGWSTATTKERLNALEGVQITQRAGTWYLNGREWGGEWVTVSEWDKATKPCKIIECKNMVDITKTVYCSKHLI